MANNQVFVQVATLPDSIQRALSEVGFNRKDIEVNIVSEPVSIESSAYGDGYQGFCALVKLDGSVAPAIRKGSWGGSNPFSRTVVDDSQDKVDLGANQLALIKGQRGGTRPVSCWLYVSSANVASFILPESVELSEGEQYILGAMKCLTSAARKPYIEASKKDGSMDSCITKGYIKKTGVGYSLTTEGKNQAMKFKRFF